MRWPELSHGVLQSDLRIGPPHPTRSLPIKKEIPFFRACMAIVESRHTNFKARILETWQRGGQHPRFAILEGFRLWKGLGALSACLIKIIIGESLMFCFSHEIGD